MQITSPTLTFTRTQPICDFQYYLNLQNNFDDVLCECVVVFSDEKSGKICDDIGRPSGTSVESKASGAHRQGRSRQSGQEGKIHCVRACVTEKCIVICSFIA